MQFWAHSDPEQSREEAGNKWQLLAEHLDAVARIARDLAERASGPESSLGSLAVAAGMLHDYGKYQECFQKMLDGGRWRCPHAIYGAVALRQMDGRLRDLDRRWLMPAVCAVAAHHAGLKDLGEHDAATEAGNPACESDQEIVHRLFDIAVRDQPGILDGLAIASPRHETGSFDLRTRMVLSCVVDADRLNTAGEEPVQQDLCAAERLGQLEAYVQGISQDAAEFGTGGEVLAARTEVQRLCAIAAKDLPGIFSLCVPTGGGKTLAAMRFALEHAAENTGTLRHVIVVIPYLSIIEQNAKVYAKVFGPGAVNIAPVATFDLGIYWMFSAQRISPSSY